MRALTCREFGSYEALKVADVDEPARLADGYVIDVRAAGVNFPDILMIAGKYQMKPDFPFIPGTECAGVIAEAGPDATGAAVGDRVIATTPVGAFAERLAVGAAQVTPMPDAMSFEEGAGFSIVYATSYHALKQRAELQPGETLLVLGAAGGVGLTAVQIGKAMGARVIAAASSPEKLAVAAANGADEGLDYSSADIKARVRELTGGKGADVVYDPVGGDFAEPALRATGWGARYLVVGFAAGDIPKIPLNLTLLSSRDIRGVFWGAWAARNPDLQGDNMRELFAMYADGRIKPHVSAAYALDEFTSAFDDIAKRRATGKVVLTMSAAD